MCGWIPPVLPDHSIAIVWCTVVKKTSRCLFVCLSWVGGKWSVGDGLNRGREHYLNIDRSVHAKWRYKFTFKSFLGMKGCLLGINFWIWLILWYSYSEIVEHWSSLMSWFNFSHCGKLLKKWTFLNCETSYRGSIILWNIYWRQVMSKSFNFPMERWTLFPFCICLLKTIPKLWQREGRNQKVETWFPLAHPWGVLSVSAWSPPPPVPPYFTHLCSPSSSSSPPPY